MNSARKIAFLVYLLAMMLSLAACGGSSGYGNAALNPSSSSSSSSGTFSVSIPFPQLPAFTEPVAAMQAPANSSRWFVVEQTGYVRVFDNVATVGSVSTFLDISARVTVGGETGLLGFAFHPNFPTDPRVFVSYVTTVNGVLTSRISSFTTADGGITINANSENILLTVTQPESNHKGGDVVFGSDGYLYIGFGDGGGEGDQHGTIGNGQNTATLLGKILRINVGAAGDTTYSIPSDNPYASNSKCSVGAGSQPCPEIYAYGFRNPWRFSFDSQTHELWAADVGQNAWEEIDLVTKGGNYGWRCYEGSHAYNTTGCTASNYIDPIWEYDHSNGDICITGGYVYRGIVSTAMQGKYIYGDYGSGRIWVLTPPSGTQAAQNALLQDTDYSISSFAQGNDGELYLLDYASGKLIKMTL